MITCGMLIADLFDILHADNDTEMQNRIWRQLNYQYFELCREVSWFDLRADPVTLDYHDSDATGLWLPSDVFGIDLVWDDDNSVEFFEKGRAVAHLDEWGYRYWRYKPSRSHLFEGSDLILNKDASSFRSATLTVAATDVEDEYVQFDDELGFYQITNTATPFTIEPTYYGPAKVNKPFRVRPWETTEKMVIIDPDEDELYDRDVEVYYWRAPVPLYRTQDMIMLPSADVLKFRVLRAIPQAKAVYPISERMLTESFQKAVKLNPKFSRVASPVDKHNRRFELGTNPFGDR